MKRSFLPPDSDLLRISNQSPVPRSAISCKTKIQKDPKVYDAKRMKFVRLSNLK